MKGGFTLVETLVASMVASIVFAGLAMGTISLSRAFKASEDFSDSTISQARILDYLGRDVRRALTVTVTSNPVKLTLTVPDQYIGTAPLRTFRDPAVTLTSANYGTAPVTISYFLSGKNFVREENGAANVIAENVSDFQPVFDDSDPSGKTVTFSLSFMPKFQRKSSADARSGTVLSASARRRTP
jgi:prepilin-type N-terminal cleavage/methylation domain-containing protein